MGHGSQGRRTWFSARPWRARFLETLQRTGTEPDPSHHLVEKYMIGSLYTNVEFSQRHQFIERL